MGYIYSYRQMVECPKLPVVPVKMIQGRLDMETRSWVDLTQPGEDASEVKFQILNGRGAIELLVDGDKIRDTGDEASRTDIVPAQILARKNIGVYFAPYGYVCDTPFALSRKVDKIIPEYLGQDWASLQVFQSVGRLRDIEGKMTVYGFLYTLEWSRLEQEEWKISVRKIYVH